MSGPTAQRRPGGRSARVRAAVHAAATDLLAERGYEQLTVEEVAARAGVHKTTVYRRWPTKADLIVDALHARSDAVIEMRDTGRLHADVLAFLRRVAKHVTSPPGRALLVATMRTSDATAGDALRRKYWDERFRRATARLEHAQEAGELDADADSKLVLEALVSPIHFRALISAAPIDDDFLRSLLRLVGIRDVTAPASSIS
jgi:AcrR family transcriptional regulator